MSADAGCGVPLPDGTACGWERDGKHPECAAHRQRMRTHGDYRAHIPVQRKPSRRRTGVHVTRTTPAKALIVHRGQVIFL